MLPKKPQTSGATTSEAPKIRIITRAFDHRIIEEATKTILETAKRSGAIISGPTPLPTEKKIETVNRSTFKHKAAKERFVMKTHKRLIDIKNPTPNTVSSLQNLILPSGVGIEIRML